MADDETQDAYDPSDPTPPEREPPLRSTAPQSEYTSGQIATGIAIALVGFGVVFGVPLLLA